MLLCNIYVHSHFLLGLSLKSWILWQPFLSRNRSRLSYLNLYRTTHQLGCVHLNSHGTKAPTTVHCSHLNAQYTHVEA